MSVNARGIPPGWPAQGSTAAKEAGVAAARNGAAILPLLTRQACDAETVTDYNSALQYLLQTIKLSFRFNN